MYRLERVEGWTGHKELGDAGDRRERALHGIVAVDGAVVGKCSAAAAAMPLHRAGNALSIALSVARWKKSPKAPVI